VLPGIHPLGQVLTDTGTMQRERTTGGVRVAPGREPDPALDEPGALLLGRQGRRVAMADVVAPGRAEASRALLWAAVAGGGLLGTLAALLSRPAASVAGGCWAAVLLLGAVSSLLWAQSGEELTLPVRFLTALLAAVLSSLALASGPALGAAAFAVVAVAVGAEGATSLPGRSLRLLVLVLVVGGLLAGLARSASGPLGPAWALAGLASGLTAGVVAQSLRSVEGALAAAAVADPLTGLPNRRALAPLLRRELARCARSGDPLTVAVIDLDGFKAVNDARGHHGGDALLVHIARTWRQALRPFDILARTGGDEFVLVLPLTTAEAALQVLHRLRRVHPQRFSAGVAQRTPGLSAGELLRQADAACYAAKRLGRGRSVVAPLTPAAPSAPQVADAT